MSGLAPRIDVDGVDFAALSKRLGLTDQAARRAYRRAADKTLTWLKRQVARDVNGTMGIPMKVLRKRLKAYRTSQRSMRAKLWLGLNAIDAGEIGKGRQQRAGVRVGKFFFRGAFKARIYGGGEKIWIRRDSKWFDPDLYPSKVRPGNRGTPPGFPVVKVRVKLDEAENRFVYWSARMEAYLNTLLMKELDLEVRRALRAR